MRASRIVRAVLAGGAATGLFLGATACGDSIDKDKLAAKVHQEGDFSTAPMSVSDCVADVLIKYGDHDDLQKYIDGKIPASKIHGSDGDQAEAAAKKCVKDAKH